MSSISLRAAGSALAIAALVAAGCTTTTSQTAPTNTNARVSLQTAADEALSRLYSTAPDSREHVARARATLVCPAVVGGSFGVGVESGRCILREGGRSTEYYRTTALSVGWQAGAASRALIYVFNTADAVERFRSSNGWSVGGEASVSIANVGANARIDTNTLQQPVVAYVLTNAGLEAGVSVQGNKFTKLDL